MLADSIQYVKLFFRPLVISNKVLSVILDFFNLNCDFYLLKTPHFFKFSRRIILQLSHNQSFKK